MPPNATGWGPADQIELILTALLAAALLWTPKIRPAFTCLAANTKLSMALLFATPVAMRLLLLPNHPVPMPDVYDEFSHLLAADTFSHLRWANPPHPLHQFFETFFVLQRPTYASIYPPGQGLLLLFGRLVAGVPWTGVLLCSGALCATCYWALRAYIAPEWALLGGLLSVIQFGPLNLWTNSYWGGTLPATAGSLVFGSLPRIAAALRAGTAVRWRDPLLLGVGFGVHMITRPFETVLLGISVALFGALFLLRELNRKQLLRGAALSAAPVALALAVTGCQDRAVTGSWRTLPESLSQYQYGVPTSLTIQQPAVPHVALTPQQALDYRAQFLTHGPGRDTPARFFSRLLYRVRYYRFFFLPPLYLALAAFLLRLRDPVFAWVAATAAVFALGTNLFPYLLVHYLAAVTCLFLLMAVAGLERISRFRIHSTNLGREVVTVLLALSMAPFFLWYGIHLFEGHLSKETTLQFVQFETWDAINHCNPERRREIYEQIAGIRGKLLILVHYGRNHMYQNEWVWNGADIDASRVVWARDLGEAENPRLERYYPNRRVYLFEPDLERPRLTEMALSQ
jgi:hypothetical protein